MKCPICHIHSLNEVDLEAGLSAYQCNHCFGHWLPSENYWEWLDSREQQQKQSSRPAPIKLNVGQSLLPVVDNCTANFCADCSRLMTKTKVGRGLNFYIDRCGHCHGVWLDQNEWENLKQMDLHYQIHYMFSSAWQHRIRHESYARGATPA